MSELTVTAKVRVKNTPEDEKLLLATMNAYRQACNHVSGHIYKTHDLKRASLNAALYRTLRTKFGLKAQMAQSVLRTVVASYKAILTNQGEWIQPEFKIPQVDLLWNRDYSLKKDMFSVLTLAGRVKLGYYAQGMEKYFDKDTYRFGTAKLVWKHGRFYLHIPVTFEVSDCPDASVNYVVGVDRGINFVVATYDNDGKSTFVNGRPIKQKRAQYAATRKQLQKRQTPSSRRRLKRIGSRENRWMQDVNHCVSKALVKNNPEHTLFVLEDLTGIRSATERVRTKDRYVSVSWAFFDLGQKLKYKAARAGSKVIEVDPAYTSQRCPKCGHIEKSNRNKRLHLFRCKKCGYTSNDDRIGGMNLHYLGRTYLSTGCSCLGAHLPGKGCSQSPHDATPPGRQQCRPKGRSRTRGVRTTGQLRAPASVGGGS